MNKYTKELQQDLKENKGKEVHLKALPTDFIIYDLDLDKDLALVCWPSTSKKKWFDTKKIIYCARAWVGANSRTLCDWYFEKFEQLDEKTR